MSGMNTKTTESLPNKAPTVATNTEDGTSSTTKTKQKVPSTVSIQGEQINPLEPRKLPNMEKGPTYLGRPYFQTTYFTKFTVGGIIKKSEITIQTWANTNISLRTLKIEDLSEPLRLILTSRAQHSNAIQFFNLIYEMIQHTPRELQPGKVMLFAVNARIMNVYLNGHIAYDSCAKCSKSVTGYDASKFPCPACQAFPVTIITRYKLLIDAADMTAQIRVTLFDKEAHEMLYQRVETSLELLKTHDG